MELSVAQQLEGIVETLVTSGEPQLDKPLLTNLKKLCKASNDNVKHVFHILLSQLQKEHSEIRFSTYQIINELFNRSHEFRLLLLENIQEYMDLTMEVDFENPLPPPRSVAEKLKQEALRSMKSWHSKYGIAYSKLALAFSYLSNVKKVKFDLPTPQQNNSRQVEEERTLRAQIVNGMKMDKLKKSMDKNMWEIKCCISEMQSCLKLLIPSFSEDQDHALNKVKHDDNDTCTLREAGLPERDYTVELDLSAISSVHLSQTDDNTSIIDQIKDCAKSASRIHLPRIRSWLSVASKCGASSDFLKNIIDTKSSLQEALQKYNELEIAKVGDNLVLDDDSDCDEFVEVPEAVEIPQVFKAKLKTESSTAKCSLDSFQRGSTTSANKGKDDSSTNVWKPLTSNVDIEDRTSYQYALAVQKRKRQLDEKVANNATPKQKVLVKELLKPTKHLNRGDGKTNTEKLLAQAPVVPFGKDLLAWDKERKDELKLTLQMGSAKELDIGHRFWSGTSASEGDSGVSDAALTSLTTRTIEFAGDFQRVTRSCRAPLPNGRLCPRQDRFKCPFHGRIIDRDPCGNPVMKDVQQPSTSRVHDIAWNDPSFLKDVEHSSGRNIQLTKKKKDFRTKASKRQESGLTNLNKIHDTSRNRLQKKVLNPGSLKRVAGTLNTLDTKRNHDKFGNNFSYALN